MAGLKEGSAEHKWVTKQIDCLEKALIRYKQENNREWIYRTETKLQFFREKLYGTGDF